MTSVVRFPVVLAIVLVAVAGCGYRAAPSGDPTQTAAPAAVSPNAVEVNVVCGGAKQVFWHGSWWYDKSALNRVRGDSFSRTIKGTMTVTGPGEAVLSSPDLVGTQAMTDSHVTRVDQPPFARCDPL